MRCPPWRAVAVPGAGFRSHARIGRAPEPVTSPEATQLRGTQKGGTNGTALGIVYQLIVAGSYSVAALRTRALACAALGTRRLEVS
jgi:hypothetical protein